MEAGAIERFRVEGRERYTFPIGACKIVTAPLGCPLVMMFFPTTSCDITRRLRTPQACFHPCKAPYQSKALSLLDQTFSPERAEVRIHTKLVVVVIIIAIIIFMSLIRIVRIMRQSAPNLKPPSSTPNRKTGKSKSWGSRRKAWLWGRWRKTRQASKLFAKRAHKQPGARWTLCTLAEVQGLGFEGVGLGCRTEGFGV